jgi:hypothetical protein
MTNLIVPFTRRASFRKLPYEYEQGRGVYSGGLRGGVTATLNLDFTTMTALPSTITFSRPSNATYYDSTGKLTYAPNNLLTYSNTFSNAAWGGFGATPTSGFSDPDGGNNAWSLALLSNGFFYNTTSITAAVLGTIWIKGSSASGTIVLRQTNGDGSVTNVVSLTTSWQRVSVKFLRGATYTTAEFGLDNRTIVGGDGVAKTIYIYAAQVEAVTYQTTPGTYNATTSAVYYGARLDYNPATLAARGLLIEEARTNLALQSNNFSSGWSLSLVTRTTDGTLASDGATAAAKYTAQAGTGAAQWYNSTVYTTVAGSTYATSFEVDGSSGAFPQIAYSTGAANWATAIFDTTTADNGTATQTAAVGATFVSATQTYLGNGRYRLTLVSSMAAGTGAYVQLGLAKVKTGNTFGSYGTIVATFTGTEYIYASFVQLELGSFATSYIPTAASSVARSADTASMTGTNFSSWYNATAGAFLVQFDTPASGTRIISAADDNTANNNIQMLTSGTDPTFLVTTSGTAQASIDAGTVAANTVYKFAGTYSANDFAACISGGTVGTDTSGTIPTVDRLRIGAGQAGNTLCGHVALLNYYPARLTDATLQSLTS